MNIENSYFQDAAGTIPVMSVNQPVALVKQGFKEQVGVMRDSIVLACSINKMVDDIHGSNVKAGWWTDLRSGMDLAQECRDGTRLGKALVGEKLCLVHSEVSEAMEGHRKGLMDDKLPHRPMIEVELADAYIRILDLAGALQLDLGGAVVEKRAFNSTRADHKPENRAAAGGKAY